MTQTNQPVVQDDPGQSWGIASLVTSLLGIGLAGIICGFIGNGKSKKVGKKNIMAIIGIVLGFINVISVTILIILMAAGGLAFFNVAKDTFEVCAERGPGTHYVNGMTINCGDTEDIDPIYTD